MSCKSPSIIIGGVAISTNDFENAKDIITYVSRDSGDPTLDAYEENIANGNNNKSTTGIQWPPPIQTSLPAEIKEKSLDSAGTAAKTLAGSNVVCIPWNNNYSVQISPNFTAKDFTVGAFFPNPLIDYMGVSASIRLCNLQGLAVNVAEPLLSKYGKMIITSGIRNKTSTPTGISQHVTGEAFDVQFAGWTYNRYWEAAKWIKDNIPYDQFIFEHSIDTGLAWYHLSYNRAGNRSESARTKVMTMYKNNYSPGLHKFF